MKNSGKHCGRKMSLWTSNAGNNFPERFAAEGVTSSRGGREEVASETLTQPRFRGESSRTAESRARPK